MVLSVLELGFYRSAKYKDLCAKAPELGLQLCAAEVGPALRLSYQDQPGGERLRIAMKAITDSYCDSIFEVVHEEEVVASKWCRSFCPRSGSDQSGISRPTPHECNSARDDALLDRFYELECAPSKGRSGQAHQ